MKLIKLKFMWLVCEYILKSSKDKSLIKLSGELQREIESKMGDN